MTAIKPKIAVHKFSSCDGCQLAFLNMGEALLQLANQVEILHFAEAGPLSEEASVDIAFVEGSIATQHDLARIKKIRANSAFLITIGACATAGGIQALRNMADTQSWIEGSMPNHNISTALPTPPRSRLTLKSIWKFGVVRSLVDRSSQQYAISCSA